MSSIHTHQSSLSHSQTSRKTEIDTSPLIKTIEPIKSFNKSISPPISINLPPQSLSSTSIPIKSEPQNEDKSSINLSSTDHPPITSPKISFSDDQTLFDKSITTDSKSILNTEIVRIKFHKYPFLFFQNSS